MEKNEFYNNVVFYEKNIDEDDRRWEGFPEGESLIINFDDKDDYIIIFNKIMSIPIKSMFISNEYDDVNTITVVRFLLQSGDSDISLVLDHNEVLTISVEYDTESGLLILYVNVEKKEIVLSNIKNKKEEEE